MRAFESKVKLSFTADIFCDCESFIAFIISPLSLLLLPGAKAVFTVTPDSPRALDGESLAKEAQKYADNIWYVPDIGKAVKMAKETAKESDVILAVGSLSYLKEVKKALGQG